MRQTFFSMGMPIIVDIPSFKNENKIFGEIHRHFISIDDNYSPYKNDSEVSKLNRGEEVSPEMKRILKLCQKTKLETNGFFDIENEGRINPSGLVKGWAIRMAADILKKRGIKNFYLEAGGDIEVGGNWKIGIRSPFEKNKIVKIINLGNKGVATSGNYERGLHIYNPKNNYKAADEISSITVIGPNVYEADRFATAAFAMGNDGISFIEKRNGLEGYMINKEGVATMTSNFSKFEE